MSGRVNPAEGLGNMEDLSDFAPRATSSRGISAEAIDQLAQKEGFPSRSPTAQRSDHQPDAVQPRVQHRFRTGRNQQINIKATAETIKKLQDLSIAAQIPLGELLRLALESYEKEGRGG